MDLQILENQFVRIELDPNRGLFDVLEKQSGTNWQHDPFTESPGELVLTVRETGKNLHLDLGRASAISLTKPSPNKATISFEGLVSEDGGLVSSAGVEISIALGAELPEFTVTVQDVSFDASQFAMSHLLYPARQFYLRTHVDEGHLVLPYNQGSLIPVGRFKVPLRDDWYEWDDLSWQESGLAWGTQGAIAHLPIYGWNGLSMPWFGAEKNGSAFVAVVDPDSDAALHCILNYNMQDDFRAKAELSPYPRIAVATPVWQSVKGEFAYPRNLIYRFLPGGTHVDMAKYYREFATKQGLCSSLKDKVSRNPEVEKLFGAPLFNIDGGYPWYDDYESFMYTWQDLEEVVRDLHDNLGVQRALICTWGGYSKLPPESLPFHPDWGTETKLRQVVDLTKELNYLYCSYHGYASNLPHASNFSPDEGYTSPSGGIAQRWGGRCSATYYRYAEANLPKILEVTGQTADYTDIIITSGGRECFHPEHALTRRQDRENKLRILDFSRSLGLVNGSEIALGYAVPHMDYSKGAMYHGQNHFLLQHIHAPLLSLVFHDCLVMYDGTVGTSRHREYSNEALECVAYGILPVFSFNMPHYAGARPVIEETTAVLSDFLRAVAQDELVHHEYLGGGYDVQRTAYSSGAQVTINTDTAPFVTAEGVEVPARGFVIEEENAITRKGAIETTFRTQG